MPLLTPFDPWHDELCSCPPKLSLSPYTGCNHGCTYCYASSYIVDFTNPRPKKDFLARLEKDLQKVAKNTHITMANSSDPYLPLEKKLKLTQGALPLLSKHDIRLSLVTKSPLITRDVDILKDFPHVIVCITLTTQDATIAKKLEPNAPPPISRLRAMEKLAAQLPVICRFDPLIHPINTGEIPSLITTIKNAGARGVITSTYKAKSDNFNRLCKTFPHHETLLTTLYKEQGQRKGRYWYLPAAMRKSLIEEVHSAAREKGLTFSSCREGFSSLNTAACDGSSFFDA